MAQQRTGGNGGKARATCTQMLVALVMIAVLIIGGVRTITKSLGSVGWPHVAGTITESETDEDGGGRVAYTYAVGDRTYTGHRISYWINSNVGGRYPVGSAVDVYYAPDSPVEAVLEPGLGRGLPSMLGCLALPVILVALAVAWVVLRSLPSLLRLRRALAGRRQP